MENIDSNFAQLLSGYSTIYAGEEKAHQKLILGVLYLRYFAV